MSEVSDSTIDRRVLDVVLDLAADLPGDEHGHLTEEDMCLLERVAAEAVATFESDPKAEHDPHP